MGPRRNHTLVLGGADDYPAYDEMFSMSAIRRGPRPHRFDILDQQIVRDSRLSFRARGILARLLSNEDGFSMTAADLAREGKEGRGAVLSALKELRDLGYVLTRRWQDERGRWNTESIVYDSPQQIESDPNTPKSKNRTSVRRTSVPRVPESSTLTKQSGEQLKKNNNSVGCCDDAQILIASPSALLTPKDQLSVQKKLFKLQPALQVQLLGELIRQRATIKNPVGWIVKMVGLAAKGDFTPSPDQKQVIVHASHLPGKADTLEDRIERGQEIWEGLDTIQRERAAVALEKHLLLIDQRGLPLKQLRVHGVDHHDVARDLFVFLAEAIHTSPIEQYVSG